MSDSKNAMLKNQSGATKRYWFESGREKVEWGITQLYFIVTQEIQPQGVSDIDTCCYLLITSFSDALTRLLLEDKLIELLIESEILLILFLPVLKEESVCIF